MPQNNADKTPDEKTIAVVSSVNPSERIKPFMQWEEDTSFQVPEGYINPIAQYKEKDMIGGNKASSVDSSSEQELPQNKVDTLPYENEEQKCAEMAEPNFRSSLIPKEIPKEDVPYLKDAKRDEDGDLIERYVKKEGTDEIMINPFCKA